MTPSYCESVRETLWPLDEPRAVTEKVRAAREHLEGCEECRRFLEADLALGRRIRETDGSTRVPGSLRERIDAALAREWSSAGEAGGRLAGEDHVPDVGAGETGGSRSRPRPGGQLGAFPGPIGSGPGAATLRWVAAAAVLALAVTATVGEVARRGQGVTPSALFARDYAHHVLATPVASHAGNVEHAGGEELLSSPSLEAVTRFLEQKTDLELEPTPIPAEELTGGMICWLEGSPASVVMYESGSHAVYYYRMRDPAGAESEGESRIRFERRGAVRMIRWSRDGVAHALVSDLPEPELRRLVEKRRS